MRRRGSVGGLLVAYRVGTGATGDEQLPISHEKFCLLPCRHYCSSVAGEVIE
jgi:hypothetical protein